MAPTFTPPQPLPSTPKARGFIIVFHICIWSPSPIFPHLHLLHSLPSISISLPPNAHTVPILQSCLLLLISKSAFQGVSQCSPTVSTLYFGQFNPLCSSPFPLLSHPRLFNSFQYISLYPPPAQMLCISILLTIVLFSFPSSPKFHREIPLLRTCSTYRFVYGRVWFCGYVYRVL
jgi:hypothetical protein